MKYIKDLGKHIEKHEIDPVVQSLKTDKVRQLFFF